MSKALLMMTAVAAVVFACSSGAGDAGDAEESGANGGCGTERWTIKIGTDTAAPSISLTSVETTIAAMRALPKPATLPTSSRIAPTERTAFEIKNVTLSIVKSESDRDYHLVIKDSSGQTMIAEVPSPSCVDSVSTPWKAQIDRARRDVDAKVGGHLGVVDIQGVTLVGVGFFDQLHGQTGVAPNAIELHPVLGICFTPDCTPSVVGPETGDAGTTIDAETGTDGG